MFKIPSTKALFSAALISASFITFNTSSFAISRTEVKQIVIEEAQRSTVPPALALAVAKVESDFQAVSYTHLTLPTILLV